MEQLLAWDTILFQFINQDWQNGFLDTILPYWRNKYVWIPLYLFIASFLVINYKEKGFLLLITIGLTVGVADITSSKIVKKSIERLRPCNDPELKDDVHLLIRCGSGYSFTSSHATNHFAIATILIFTFGHVFRWIRLPLFFWAASIAFGQVYVGVHYPLDIIGGAILGILIGGLGAFVIRQLQLDSAL